MRTISFDVEIGEYSVEIGEHSVEISEPSIEIGETSVEAGEDFDAYTEDDDFSETSVESGEDENNTFEDYSTPDFEFLSDSAEAFEDTRFAWILLWIMNFRLKFNLSATATEVLIKFMRLVLIEISGDEFKRFCKNLNKTKQFLGLSNKFISFVVCPKCHKLY